MTPEQVAIMDRMLSEDFYLSPYKFAMWAYDWGNGDLQQFPDGPRRWQKEIMLEIEQYLREAIALRATLGFLPDFFRLAVASGRGPGKSALIGMLTHWYKSTRIGGSAWVAANGEPQLRTKTFPEIAKWFARGINAEFFEINATSIVPAKWFKEFIESPQGLGKSTKYYYVSGQLWSAENPDAFAGAHNFDGELAIFDEACHDDQTDVLTKRGWVRWEDVTLEDEFMTMNPVSHVTEYQKPIRLYVYDHDGEMCSYQVKGANFVVTPNHEMYYTTRKLKGLYKKRAIAALKSENCFFKRTLDWIGEEQENHIIPALKTERKQFDEKTIDMDVWLEFLGWYMSEGNLVAQNGNLLCTTISNHDHAVLRRVEHLMRLMGYTPKIYECSGGLWQVRIHDRQLAAHLGESGVGCKVKFTPDYVRMLSPRQIRIYLDAYREGDGYIKGKAEVIYTSSPKMADTLQELYLKLGMRCSLSKRKLAGQRNWIVDHWGTSSTDGFVIQASQPTAVKFREKHLRYEHYKGKVYCAEVPNHLLYTRRNGQALWSGNSGIPDSIWTVQEGVFTENIPDRFWLAFSNPRQNEGAFFECFHKNRAQWRTKQIDSRTVEGISTTTFDNIIAKFGADSDEARVEVYGQFPNIGDNQFISRTVVDDAVRRESYRDEDAPIVIGVDVARFGTDRTCIVVRQGRDIVTIKRFSKLDTMQVVGHVILAIEKYKPALVCIDEGGLGAGVVDRLKEQRYKVRGVNFGYKSSKKGYFNKRTEMWGDMREWLETASLPDDPELKADLLGPRYKVNSTGQVQLESKDDMKKRGIASPDAADALALCFSHSVSMHMLRRKVEVSEDDEGIWEHRPATNGHWMGC